MIMLNTNESTDSYYYCYMNCDENTLRGYLEHRQIEIPHDSPKTLLVALLRQDDMAIIAGKEPTCFCCPHPKYDPGVALGHFGCEQCPPHYDKKKED